MFLALVEKHESGVPDYRPPRRSFGDRYSDDSYEEVDMGNSAGHTMQYVTGTTISLKKVVAEDDEKMKLELLEVGEKEATFDGRALFKGLAPNTENFYVYYCIEGAYLDYFYHRTVLLILLRAKTFHYACSGSFEDVVRLVQYRANSKAVDAENTLLQAVKYAQDSRSEADISLADLLDIASKLKNKDAALSPLALMGKVDRAILTECILRKQVDVFVNAVVVFGWEELSSPILKVLRNKSPEMLGHVASFATEVRDGILASFDPIANVVTDAIESDSVHDNSATKVAYMIFKLPSCERYREAFLSKCNEMSPSCLAGCIVGILDWYAEEGADRGVPAEIAQIVRIYISVAFTATAAKSSAAHAGRVLSRLLCTRPRDEKLQSEISSEIANTNCIELLRATLRFPDVSYEKGDPYILPIMSALIVALQYHKPVQNYAQLQAHVSGHPDVANFLRSSTRSFDYQKFENMKLARRFARRHFQGVFNHSEKHCEMASAHKNRDGPYVTRSKIVPDFEMKLERHKADQEEAQELEKLLRNYEVTTGNENAKRRRTDSKTVDMK